MSGNLPDVGHQQYLAAVKRSPAFYTHAAKVERQTSKEVTEKAARTYVALLEEQANGAIAREHTEQTGRTNRARLEEGIASEEVFLGGVAHLTGRARTLAARGGELTAQAVGEHLAGSLDRLADLAADAARDLRR